MEIYLKQKEKITVQKGLEIRVGDLCDIISEDNSIKDLVVYKIPSGEYKRYVITNIDITRVILDYDNNIGVNISGITDTVVEYKKETKENFFTKLKVLIVAIIIFTGASTTIMSFHNETAIPEVFDEYYKLFFGLESYNSLIITLPYSIGIALGIILFFNHVFGKSFTDSPTPIEVEIIKYESDIAKAEAKLEEHELRKGQQNGWYI